MAVEWEGEHLWGELNSFKIFDDLMNRYRAGESDSVKADIIGLIKNQPAIPILLIGTRWNEEGVSETFSRWLIQQKELFPSDQEMLDLGLRTSIFKWRWDGVALFCELGANVNQSVLPERTLFDIACARSDFGFYCSDEEPEMEQTVASLTNAGAKHALELAWSGKLACQFIFKSLPQYDDWAEKVVADLQGLDAKTQEGYSQLFAACLNKSKVPSKKWWASAMQIVDQIGKDDFLELLPGWLLAACGTRKTLQYGYFGAGHLYRYSYMPKDLGVETRMISGKSSTLLKSLLWLTDLLPAKDRTALLQEFAAAMFITYPNFGIRSPKLSVQSFGLLIQDKAGYKTGQDMMAECKHKPTLKKMDSAFAALI